MYDNTILYSVSEFQLNRNYQNLMIFYCFIQIKNTSVHTVHDQDFVICTVWIISFSYCIVAKLCPQRDPHPHTGRIAGARRGCLPLCRTRVLGEEDRHDRRVCLTMDFHSLFDSAWLQVEVRQMTRGAWGIYSRECECDRCCTNLSIVITLEIKLSFRDPTP